MVCDPAYEYAEGLAYELTVGEKKKKKKFAKSDQFAPELIYFAQCVRQGKTPEPSGKEGLIDVAIIEAIHESMASGEWVELTTTPRQQQSSNSAPGDSPAGRAARAADGAGGERS